MRLGNRRFIEKAVRLSYQSSFGNNADVAKFDCALALHKKYDEVYGRVCRNVLNPDRAVQEACLVTWLVANTAIRIGGSSSELRENGVVGASTLSRENLSVRFNKMPDGSTQADLTLSFTGKDSVPFHNEYTFDSVDDVKACGVLNTLLTVKKPGEKLFMITSTFVNKVLHALLPSEPLFSAKMFRPAKGTALLCGFLEAADVSSDLSDRDNISLFKKANLETARLLNHKRNVGKSTIDSIEKQRARIEDKKVELRACADLVKQAKLEAQIADLEAKLEFRDETKTDALSTSLGSYIDPRAVSSWCASIDLDISKLYTKSLLKRFEGWIADTDPDFWKEWL